MDLSNESLTVLNDDNLFQGNVSSANRGSIRSKILKPQEC